MELGRDEILPLEMYGELGRDEILPLEMYGELGRTKYYLWKCMESR